MVESYLNRLPSSQAKPNTTEEYNQVKNDLIYPMQKLTIDQNEGGKIQDRIRRLRSATGTLLDTATSQPISETPKPDTEPTTKTSLRKSIDPFEATLYSKPSFSHHKQAYPMSPPVQKPPSPVPPPPLAPSTPPAIPNSPRPPRPQQQEKVRTLNPMYAGLDCHACHKAIEGSVVSAMNEIWHASCFRCYTCHKSLENEQYFEKDGNPYCGKDYRDLFSLRCDYCHEPIEQKSISVLGKHYHEGHFCCTLCRKPFGDHSSFLLHDEKPYCQEDYLKVCGKKCSGCGEYILGEYVSALDRSWHKNCFTCADCKKPFRNGTYLVRNNKPYCEEHYHQPKKVPPPILKPKPVMQQTKSTTSVPTKNDKDEEAMIRNSTDKKEGNAKICHQCREVIDGASASALGHDYHIHHFQCSQCSRALSSRVPGMWQGDEQGELICKMCAFNKRNQH
ncbi:MAG: hypothetical protein EXX96DRAFT_545624 [Benjaminiella poitrasii]|nr:MAG: hypothetical protein EXX96DRAFT_545624 [Benjaminiella poitrasii]